MKEKDIGSIIREEEEKLRSRLIDIYNEENEDVKEIICLLIQREYELAIAKDNYNRSKDIKAHNLEEYKEKNKELIEKCWLSRVGR